jgi:hypothetical protein
MIRTAKVIFCDNEHGVGDLTFPDLDELDAHQLKQYFIEARNGGLRKEAKKAGWTRVNGADLCPGCSES